MKHADGIDELFECVALTADYNPILMEQTDRQVLSYSSIPLRPRFVRRALIGIALFLSVYGFVWIVLASCFSTPLIIVSDVAILRSPPHEQFPTPFRQLFEPAYCLDRSLRPEYWGNYEVYRASWEKDQKIVDTYVRQSIERRPKTAVALSNEFPTSQPD